MQEPTPHLVSPSAPSAASALNPLPPHSDSLLRTAPLLLLIASLFANFLWLGEPPLARTEGHRALTAHQMVQHGNWVVPELFGRTYVRKPPLQYWAIAATEMLTGRADETVWRLPSALAAVALCLIVWGAGRRWYGAAGGAAAGFVCFGMVALWSQNRSADIDSLNTLASTACAVLLLELGFAAPRRRWLISILLALSFAALLLLKGPAGLPVVVGVMVGASLISRRWRWLASPLVWVPLIVGGAGFAAWALAALPSDQSGVAELRQRLTPDPHTILLAISLPFVIFAYALPYSLALPIVLRTKAATPPDRIAHAVAGSLLACLALFTLSLTGNPRYAYVALPLVALLCGSVAENWHAHRFSPAVRTRLRQVASFTAIALASLHLAAAWLAAVQGSVHRGWLAASSVAAVVVMLGTIRAWVLLNQRGGAWGLALLLVLLAIPANAFKNLDRIERSGLATGRQLHGLVGDGATVTAESLVADHPEVFHYAAVNVKRYPHGLPDAFAAQKAGWIAFDAAEWAEFSKALAPHLSRIQKLDLPEGGTLAWYSPTP
jgi:4-amino-4-deoxy-L-arabinose transferase-like glycosyltransferase